MEIALRLQDTGIKALTIHGRTRSQMYRGEADWTLIGEVKHHPSIEIKGDKVGILEMRRHLSNYFKGLPDFKQTRLKLVTLNDVDEINATLDYIADHWGDYDMSGAVPPSLSHEI